MKLYILIAIVLLSAAVIAAQEKPVTAEPIFLGRAQPTVDNLPLPEYPKDARKAGFGGRISVAVTVDDSGKVTSADDADGPYPVCKSVTTPNVLALRLAATNAAGKAMFKPAVVDQILAWASGRIVYTFTPVGYKPKKEVLTGARADGYSGARVVDNSPQPKESQAKEVRPDRLTVIGTADMPTGAKIDPNYKPQVVASGTGKEASESKTISGGVLNGKALALPRPSYPAAAKAVRAGGAVSVQVLILEDGSMYSAEAVSGHPLLRRAAETAACGSKFMPTLLSDKPVKVAGIITYNFVP